MAPPIAVFSAFNWSLSSQPRRSATAPTTSSATAGEVEIPVERIPAASLTNFVRRLFVACGIAKKGSCHLFRHAMATLMLEHGADIRYIQEMLGHASLQTTQGYTKVAIQKLKQIHDATHPGARLARCGEDERATAAAIGTEPLRGTLAEERAGEG